MTFVEPDPVPPSSRFTVLSALYLFIRTRLVQGLFVALPIAITFWILHWLYQTLRHMVIDPVAWVVVSVVNGNFVSEDRELDPWFENFAAPLIAVVIVLAILYFLGMFFQSRLHRLVDWVLLQLPIVTTVYSAVSQVFSALGDAKTAPMKFGRVVLVEFPHPGCKAPAFVTATCRDNITGKKIVCVYIPSTPLPTTGYMLMFPEEQVIDIDWDLNQTLQSIVSGGISTPKHVNFYHTPPAPIEPKTEV